MIQICCQVLYRIDPSCSEERFRMFLGEFTLVVCFIAGAFSPSDPNRVTAWLNLWSLYAYCFHVMWYRLFGSPYGAIITFAGIPIFYFMTAASKPKESQESQEPKKPKDSKAWGQISTTQKKCRLCTRSDIDCSLVTLLWKFGSGLANIPKTIISNRFHPNHGNRHGPCMVHGGHCLHFEGSSIEAAVCWHFRSSSQWSPSLWNSRFLWSSRVWPKEWAVVELSQQM